MVHAGRVHAYGDVYSNPGLSLQQKQLITSAFLVSNRSTQKITGNFKVSRL